MRSNTKTYKGVLIMKKSLTDLCLDKLSFLNIALGKEYNYSCLPLAVIDAIYSIRLNYNTVKKIVDRYCKYYGVAKYRQDCGSIHTISDLIKNINVQGCEKFASGILMSNNKTAGINSNLKSYAVLKWAEILKENNIENFDDIKEADLKKLENKLKSVKGQGEAAVKYFFMLCGCEKFCKPDRHIINFFSNIEGYTINQLEAQWFMESVVKDLNNRNIDITVRQLDYIIWCYQKRL